MAAKLPSPYRAVNVNVSFDHDQFIRRLIEATGWTGTYRAELDGSWKPGSYTEENLCGPIPSGSIWGDIVSKRGVNYLFTEILSKLDDGKPSDHKRDEALRRFALSEDCCRAANKRLFPLVGMPAELANTDFERIVMIARSKIKKILGRLDYNAIADGFCFTGGASLRVPKRIASVPHKYSGTPETTYGNLALTVAAISAVPLWKHSLTSEVGPMHLKLVRGNKIDTVAKNYKTDRIIAIEPDMNMYVQKGFGNYIRKRLRYAGLDLATQENNQKAALRGSLDGSLATIDLSMASDTVPLELVRLLLPPKWAEALEQCRSPQGVLPSGETVYYQKFSSMGNGYTFELETLLFYGLSLAVCDYYGVDATSVCVYGDDIIAPTAIATELIDVLNQSGFTVNEGKTFIEGDFRESCGKHYYLGHDVSPFYVKATVTDLVGLFKLHNKLARWAQRNSDNLQVESDKMSSLLLWLRNCAPRQWRRPRIPDGYGDGAFIGSFDQCLPKRVNSKKFLHWEGFRCQVLQEVAEFNDFHEKGYGTVRKDKSFRRGHNPPSVVGRFLQSLQNIRGSSHDGSGASESLGGVSKPPRLRLVDIVVVQFH